MKTFEWTADVGPGVTEPGPVTWDGSQDPPLEGTAEPGVYLFRWEVGGPGPTMDADQDKSAEMSITETHTEIVSYNEASDMVEVSAKCVLVDGTAPVRDATEAHVTTYGPSLALLSGPSGMPTATNSASASPPVWNSITFGLRLDEPGRDTHLFCARDNCASEDRAHRNRWALQRNYAPVHPRADNYAEIADEPGIDRTARYWQKLAGYAAWANGAAGAGTVCERLPGDRIFFFSGHGNAGGSAVATSDAAVLAKGSATAPHYNLSALDLRKVRLTVWLACYTGAWDDTFGGVAEMAQRRGARCSVGWPATTSYDAGDVGGASRKWAQYFFQALMKGPESIGPPVSVTAALNYAAGKVNQEYPGNSYHFQDAVVSGDGATVVAPVSQ